MRIIVFYPNGIIDLRHVKCRPGNGKDIHAVVDPILETSYLEHVNVFWTFEGEPARYLDAFVHEEGRLIGLPMNRNATKIYLNNVRVHDPKRYDPTTMDYIAGPMILFEEKVWI
jgi:hypothetical protein